jgi:2-dehydro-3-deoxyphosphogluconate aldolase/(4S)-4-hydroxy-2-oxoglutarate aldolase
MARFERLQVLNTMLDTGLVPVFYHADVEIAAQIVNACAEGGARVIEFTNRGDLAYRVFCDLAARFARERPEVILGVGSVVDAGTAALYLNSGANFVVGPVFNPEVARACNRRKVAYSPGCGSASEISQAEEAGCEIVKLFPGKEVGGPAFVKAMLGPCPWTKIMPTGGVDATEESISAWIKAGTACLGIGSNLITKEIVAAGDWAALTRKVEQCLWWVKKARGVPLFLGCEHVGLYPKEPDGGAAVASWYASTFGLSEKVGNSSIFVSGAGPGRLEVFKEPKEKQAHVAIRVAHFEEAVRVLRERGVALEEPTIKDGVKAVFLKEPDPAGHRVHLFWSR